ncbi:unnamed protein product [Echinostoma caproni]|uniref:G-protein alpha subunit n=1 Tax=Echinostoma caproni TaxID=27848 RepID=A0A183A8F4_9TREM|nr:unnamed protein product [Echinostoma caproni]
MSDGISEVQFEIANEEKSPVRFRVFDVSGQRGARKKWIQFFDSVTAILFVVDCGSFEQTLREDHNQNRLMDSLEVFEQAWSNKSTGQHEVGTYRYSIASKPPENLIRDAMSNEGRLSSARQFDVACFQTSAHLRAEES